MVDGADWIKPNKGLYKKAMDEFKQDRKTREELEKDDLGKAGYLKLFSRAAAGKMTYQNPEASNLFKQENLAASLVTGLMGGLSKAG